MAEQTRMFRASILDAVQRIPTTSPDAQAIGATDTEIEAGSGTLQLGRTSSGDLTAFFPFDGQFDPVPPQAGLALEVTHLRRGPDRPLEQHLALRCTDRVLEETFIDLLAVLAGHYVADSTCADSVTRSQYLRWRALFGPVRAVLSESKAVGLFGELVVLNALAECIGPAAIDHWDGPTGARHDFAVGDAALEVKTTRSHAIDHVRINGAEQLAVPVAGSLHLLVLRIEARNGGRSIASEFSDLVAAGVDPLALRELIGEVMSVDSEPAERGWAVLEERLYLVDSEFPRVIPASFSAGVVPRGVIELDYTVSLGAIDPITDVRTTATWIDEVLGP